MFGLDALEKVTQRQYRCWLKYFEVNGPVWWKRSDWNFANVISSVAGGKTSENLLRFRRVESNASNQAVMLVSAFGNLPPGEIRELEEAAEIYG